MAHKIVCSFAILMFSLCSSLVSAQQRQATVEIKIPGYKTPENDHGRKWYVYFASAAQTTSPIQGAVGIIPGILSEIPTDQFLVDQGTSVATFDFTFTDTAADGSGATLYIAYGFAPKGSCCYQEGTFCQEQITQSDCVTNSGTWFIDSCSVAACMSSAEFTGNPLIAGMDDMWFAESEFIFHGANPSQADQGDITYVAAFSHPLAVDVYGKATDAGSWDLQTSREPLNMVKQILVNEIYNSDGFRGADGNINTSRSIVNQGSVPAVWMSGEDGGPANTKLWQDPNVSGQTWDPKADNAGFIRVNQPNTMYPTIAAGNAYLPGYQDAMELLYQKYPSGGTKAILVAGNYTPNCNSQQLYANGNPTQGGVSLCSDNVCPGDLGTFGHSAADLYRVWAQIGQKLGDGGSPDGYWFEVTATNPQGGESGYIKASGPDVPHIVPLGTLYIPQSAPSSSTTTINSDLYGRLVKGDVTAGAGLPAMVWNDAAGTNVFTNGAYAISAVAFVRDICATVSNGQLGSEVEIGYAFNSSSESSGYFWEGAMPNKRGTPIQGAQYSAYFDGNSSCCCIPVWNSGGGGSQLTGFTGTTDSLATGQLQWLNNWFDDLATQGQTVKPWNDSYAVMFDLLGSGVYTSNYSDYYKYFAGIDPQFRSNTHQYMKYVFTLGTMTFADFTNNGMVGVHDLLYMLENWGLQGKADLNSNQIVNTDDLTLLLHNWTGS
jgi:hypothetical protein